MDDEEIEVEAPSMDWLLTFADLVSLLITFFVLLYSMKVVDVQKWDELRGSFSGVFSIRDPIHQVNPDKDTAIEKIDPMKSDNLDYVQALLEGSFKKDPILVDINMTRDYELDTLNFIFSSDGVFKNNTAELSGEKQLPFIRLGDILRHLDNRLVVAVHTDPNIIKSRQFPSNWELTMIRAIRVAELLEAQGIVQSIVTTCMGDSKFDDVAPSLPIGERYKLARRIEIVLHGVKEL
ncbi:MAG: chemotaxis protein MotB [Alphaproteobacteria bacterium]|jgi:chemotaxis protein MotB